MKHWIKNITLFVQNIRNKLVQRSRYLCLLVLGRDLNVEFPPEAAVIALHGNPVSFHWKVSGCYMIVINDLMRLPGNATRLHFGPVKTDMRIKICFYGCNSVFEKTMAITCLGVDLKRKYNMTCLPDQFRLKRTSGILSHSAVPGFHCTLPLQLATPQLSNSLLVMLPVGKSDLHPLTIELEAYNPENYNLKHDHEKRLLRNP